MTRRSDDEATSLLAEFERRPLKDLLLSARALADQGHGRVITYSRKVFIPLTRLCRDVCAYCTFAARPSDGVFPYLRPEQVLDIARRGRMAGCHEALFTLGDKPELRYNAARDALAKLGHATTVEYVAATARLVLDETGLLPHINAGVMSADEIAAMRKVSVSQGIMLENVSSRLCQRGGPHFGSPDKDPLLRLSMIETAGRLRVPFTSGILIGIGETRLERVHSLLALRDLHLRYGHLQEVITQNFRAKADTRMAMSEEPGFEDLLWTAAVARHVLGGAMNIQAPPNLSHGDFPRLIAAGINDWGGISPVTPDHVNPEAPWPSIERLALATSEAGYSLCERLAIYPEYAVDRSVWVDDALTPQLTARIDASGFPRTDPWTPGVRSMPPTDRPAASNSNSISAILKRSSQGDRLDRTEVNLLFRSRGSEIPEICAAADELRARANGDDVTYVVTRNINYTNVCLYSCRFCAFSKGRLSRSLRGTPYDLSHEEVARRVSEARDRGATEVCMQGGIHPYYTGDTYLALLRAAKEAQPAIHVHAFSPLEIAHGAETLGLSTISFLERLQAAGLGSLPGTAAEILSDPVRRVICPDKLTTRKWLDIVAAAHKVGLRTTATIMFGHVETVDDWSQHLLHIRDLQEQTGGFTEFVPLPFVHMEAPMHLKGLSRKGPTWRETVLMHAIARLVLNPVIPNIQTSWVKLGPEGIRRMLDAGVNDLGGTLMNESISTAAGTQHGQEFAPLQIEALIRSAGRQPRQRTTLYGRADEERRHASFDAGPLAEMHQTPIRRAARQLASL